MVNTKPGYWDVDRCCWVGVDSVEIGPPVRHAEHTHAKDHAGIPEPRTTDAAPESMDSGRPAEPSAT